MEARCLAERDVHRYGIPRTDLKVTLDGVEIKPALALGGWVALEPSPDGTMVMDDLVLTETGQATLTSKRRVFHSLEVTSPVPSSFSRRRGADAPGTICQQLMKPTAPGTICHRHGDQPLMGTELGGGTSPDAAPLIAEHGHCAARFLLASRNGKVIFPSWLGLECSS